MQVKITWFCISRAYYIKGLAHGRHSMNAVEPHLEKEWTGKMSEYGLPVHSPYEKFYAQGLLLSGMTLESSLFIGGHILNPITYLKTINLEV